MVLKPRVRPAGRADLGARHERSGAGGRPLLRDLQKKHNLAYLFISHDLKVVRALANEVIVMRSRQGGRAGRRGQIFDQPQDRLHQGADGGRLQSRDRGVVRRT
jgi:ABC-type sulfate/molybdate transport systems ATPase subunit